KGKLTSGTVPLGESGFTGEIEVGAQNPLKLLGTSLRVSPVVVEISAQEVEARKKEKETAEGALSVEGAAVGGTLGAIAGSGLMGPIPALLLGGPSAAGEKGYQAGGQLGHDVGAAVMAEQTYSAELVQGSVSVALPLHYAPWLSLSVGVL